MLIITPRTLYRALGCNNPLHSLGLHNLVNNLSSSISSIVSKWHMHTRHINILPLLVYLLRLK